MALSKLSHDEQGIVFSQLCNVLDPGIAVALSSVSHELRAATLSLLKQLEADHKAAAALCRKLGDRRTKKLRKARSVYWHDLGLIEADLSLLGTLGSVLPALKDMWLHERAAGPDSMQRLAKGLGEESLPAVISLHLSMHAGDAGASAFADALGRGALPRLQLLSLEHAAIGDAGLVALASALRRRPALTFLHLSSNLFGDEGLAALVAPPSRAGAPPTTTAGLKKLKLLDLASTQVTDAGCAILAAALKSGALPALKKLFLSGIPASAAAQAAVCDARAALECDWKSYTYNVQNLGLASAPATPMVDDVGP